MDLLNEVYFLVRADHGQTCELFGRQKAALEFVREEREAGHAMPDAVLVWRGFRGDDLQSVAV